VIYTRSDGTQFDLTSGELVGQGQPTQVTAQEARRPETADVYPATAGKTALDALQQLSFGFNSALFALPDAVIRQVGKAAGVSDEEIPTFVRYFSRGQTAPKNAIERYANAIGQGMGGTIPATGVLGAVARTKALTGPLSPSSPVTKQIAKETLDFIRTNPIKAVGLDLSFGGAYGGIEQAVEEGTEPGMARDVLKATVPIGATVAIPALGNKLIGVAQSLVNLSPTVRAARAIAGPGPTTPGTEGFDYFHPAVAETVPQVPGLRGPIGMMGNWYGSRAQKSISQELRTLLSKEGGPEVMDQLAFTNYLENLAKQPGMEDVKFVFSLPESTLIPALRQAYNDVVQSASPSMRGDINARMDANIQAMTNLARRFTPQANMSLDEALVMHSAERNRVVDDALKKVTGLEEGRRLELQDRFNQDTNLSDIGNILRSGILAQREAQMNQFRLKADEIAGRPFGVRVPVREGLETQTPFPTALFKDFATGFAKKYNLTPDNRFFSGEVPAPAKEMLRTLSKIRSEEESLLPRILDRRVDDNLQQSNPAYKSMPADEQAGLRKYYVDGILDGTLKNETYQRVLKESLAEVDKTTKNISLTLPEAVDFLQSAQRYKTYMAMKAQDDMNFGLQGNFADQVKRNGEELLRDVEKFVFNGFKDAPGIKELRDIYDRTFTNGYDNLFALTSVKKRPTGEFVWGDKQFIDEALKSRENLRALNQVFGDNPTYARHLESAMLAKAQASGVINKDGLMDLPAYNRFLANMTRSGVMDELPASVQSSLRNEFKMGQAFADDLAIKKAEVDALKDEELDRLVKKSIRPDADSAALVKQAMEDPAVMRKLVSTVGQNKDYLESMRRQFWEGIVSRMTDPNDPVRLSDYMTRYGKSMNILYTPEHLNNLRGLAAIQERVFAVNRPTGGISPFATFDVRLREQIGAGVGTVESVARAAMIRQISPQHAVVSLLTRFLSRQQQSIADKILLSALTDPLYAQKLIAASAPLDTPKGFNQVAKLTFEAGGFLPAMIRNAPRVASIEATQAAEDETIRRPLGEPRVLPQMTEPAPRPPVPQMPARVPSMLEGYQQEMRQRFPKPVAPAATPVPTTPPAPRPAAPAVMTQRPGKAVPQMPPSQPNVDNEMYRMLFPTDFVSPMLPRGQ
jgi:hypothetical protein